VLISAMSLGMRVRMQLFPFLTLPAAIGPRLRRCPLNSTLTGKFRQIDCRALHAGPQRNSPADRRG
jgi:hypothetical protein